VGFLPPSQWRSPADTSVIDTHDRRTRRYVTPDGHLYWQADLVWTKEPKTWKDMLVSAG
jgi:phospholipid/cholesterol/gamma-HCH transport system substrate-binding protein